MSGVREPVAVPVEFAEAVRSLSEAMLRPEVQLEPLRAPQRLAPWTHAVALQVVHGGVEVATGRLILLHDPDARQAWSGSVRLVGYASVDLDPEMARDPLLAEVGWSWLLDALTEHGARHAAAAGTVTYSASTRFGELAPDAAGLSGPGAHRPAAGDCSCELELRASWTPLDIDLAPHLRGWASLLCTAAGLPPPGVTALPGGRLDLPAE